MIVTWESFLRTQFSGIFSHFFRIYVYIVVDCIYDSATGLNFDWSMGALLVYARPIKTLTLNQKHDGVHDKLKDKT